MIPTYEPAPTDTTDIPLVRPDRLDHTETAQIRKAVHHVTHLYPGAAGKILSAYLSDYYEFGYRIAQTALPAQLVEQVLAQIPEQR